MPKLEVLEVIGFKSFADKTHVRFDTGVTAIVGPNGCGKSNIADAINWVVGEQSAKSLRADRMEDVIFNGTHRRKALGFSEVSLQIRDYERLAAAVEGGDGDRKVETVTVTRRLYRSGESEYLINDRRCRLKDIYELLEGTGLGHNSYALIEQGRIDQILSAKPQDRRGLIEEAAKVSVFKSRKKAAEIKLELSQQNLLRINDIIGELQRQAEGLKRQAAKARRYARLREELRTLHRARIGTDFLRLQEQLSGLQMKLEGFRRQDQGLLQLGREGEAQRARLAGTLEALEKQLDDLRNVISGLEVQLERASQQRRFYEQQTIEGQRRSGEAREQAREIRQRLLDRESLELEHVGQLEEARRRLKISQEEADRFRLELENVQRSMESIQQEIERLRQYTITHADRLAELRTESARVAESRANLVRQMERTRTERSRLAAEQCAAEEHLQGETELLEQSREQWNFLKESVEELAEDLTSLGARQEEANQELTDLSEQYSMVRHRLASLEEIEVHHSNYSEGTQKFLNAGPTDVLRVSGTIAELVEANPEFEAVIEDYLNEQLQYVVVENLSEALKGVARVKEIRAGKCTFMSLAGINGYGAAPSAPAVIEREAESGFLGPLRAQLRMEPALDSALRRVLPDFSSTYIVRDIDMAMRLSHENPQCAFLTMQGEYLSARGLLSAIGERKGAVGLLSLRREKRELEGRNRQIQQRIEESRAALVQLRAQLRDGQESLARSQRELHQADLEKTRREEAVAALAKESERLAHASAAVAAELEKQAADSNAQEQQSTAILDAIGQLESTSQSSESTISDLAMKLSEEQLRRDAVQIRYADARMDVATLQERVVSLEREGERYSQEHGELEARRMQAESEAAEAEQTVVRLHESGRSLGLELERLAIEKEQRTGEWRGLQEQHQQAKEEQRQSEEALAAFRAEREELHQRISEEEVERARCETEMTTLDRSCIEEFHLPVLELLEAFDPSQLEIPVETIPARYAEVREKVEGFGNVNMAALEEYQELDQRLQHMLQQRADVESSIATTLKTIEEISRRAVDQFQDAFQQINSHFSEVFQILFNGGHAEMRLMDEADPMESGIEIIASPPGKRLQNIMLLSGGEKALTALALLMGIFKFRPGPFCVLDEVDAPLDDANVQRFTNMLTQMSVNTQFVVITHNKRTLEAAQFLYGVTMQEPGVSKLVSVRFN